MEERERHVSGSEFKTFRRCRRKWMIEYVLRVTLPKPEAGALGTGILSHAGLETITNGGTLDEAKLKIKSVLGDTIESLADLPPEVFGHAVESWTAAADDAQNYVTGYVEWLEDSGADQRYETYGAEEELTMDLVEFEDHEGNKTKWVLRGKLDRRAYDRFTEQHLFMDYKTCARFEDITEAAPRNEQFPTYELLLRHNYPDERCGSGVWRMLRKVKRAKDGDGEFYRDHQATYNDKMLDALTLRYQLMAGEMHAIETFVKQGKWFVAYPNPTWSCAWDCPYRHECPMFDDGSRVEDAIKDMYVEFDPYARYGELKGSD